MGTGSHCNVPRAFHTQFRGPSDNDATSQGLPQRPGDDCPNDTSMCQAYPTSLSSQGDEAKTRSSHFPRQEIGLERGRDFYSRVPSQDFLEILASEATGNHSPKWKEGLEVKGAAADPTDLPTLGWGLSLSLSQFLPHCPSAGVFPSLLSHVRFLVADKVGAPGEVFPTQSAPVGLLPSVGPLVCSKVGDVAEGPPTLGALIGPLARVRAVVHTEAGAVAEALAALTADVGRWLQVRPVMHRQRGTLAEALATEVTAVRPLAQVILLVRGKV